MKNYFSVSFLKYKRKPLIVLLVFVSSSFLEAQTFTQLTGTSNPFDGVDVIQFATPVFADLDFDGDADAFIGSVDGTIYYYRNDGSAVSPSFANVTGADNPFNGVDVGDYSGICFGDIDKDGDLDAFIGELDGYLNFFRNDGDYDSPAFTEVTGASNPLNGVSHSYSLPRFTDLDCDGDLDICIADAFAWVRYYKNTGTPLVPTYVQQTSTANPFYNIGDMGNYSAVEMADFDMDGDVDAFMGNGDGFIYYGENSGDAVTSSLALVSGAGNPFDGIDVGNASYLSLYDLDGDGDLDAFIGRKDGTILSYANGTHTLPVELISFSAEYTKNGIVLSWQTATEVDNYGFEIERTSTPESQTADGLPNSVREWEKIGFVEGSGNSNSPRYYTFIDDMFLIFGNYSYRLKQIDTDGSFAYSDEINVFLELPEKFCVEPNYPNPFNSSTMINFHLPNDGLVTVKIYDIMGRHLETLVEEKKIAGIHKISFDASKYSSGVYFSEVCYDGYLAIGKMIFLR